MPRLKMPHPDTMYGEHETGVKLFAWDQKYGDPSARPFFVTCKLILPAGRRRSYWLSWMIEEQRFARTQAAADLDAVGLLEWAAGVMREEFATLEQAHGMDAQEAAAARAAFASHKAETKRHREKA